MPRGAPRTELRIALSEAAQRLTDERPEGLTWHDLAAIAFDGRSCAPSELRLVRHTCSNMVRAGELAVVGFVHTPGVCRPMRRMRWAGAQEGQHTAGFGLQSAMRRWLAPTAHLPCT